MPEFKAWPKMGRDNPFMVTITEKIDGTNSCIIIEDGEVVAVQSRKRFITPDDDNYGFATWVEAHKEELKGLGDGYHYGEWAGPGIQKNPLKLPEKTFFLFHTYREGNCPECCKVVPVLFQGIMDQSTVPSLLANLEADPEVEHEGVVVYYHAFRMRTKHTIKNPGGKWAANPKED